MKRLVFLIISVSLFFVFFSLKDSDAAIMEDYCVVPPYVIQDVPPNVMIVLDNSGSMFGFAYYDGMDTADTSDDKICEGAFGSGSHYSCTCTNDPCTDFNSSHEYYGYFNPDYWYTYSSNRFVPAARKTEARPASSWDGNFLNWLTMRRIDIIRKVMTGGRTTSGEGSGYNRLIGEKADEGRRGIYKRIGAADNYTPYTGARKFVFNTGSSSPSTFRVRNAADDGYEGTTFNVAVKVPIPVEGVLQNVVGTRARLGLSFYDGNTGGEVRVPVAGGSLSSTVNEINLSPLDSNTPIGETLWTMTGYFAQQASIAGGPGPRYSSGAFQINNNVDPYNFGTGGSPRYTWCAKSFILFITDGEPCADGNLPNSIENYADGRSDFNCVDTNCPAAGPFAGGPIQSICTAGDAVAGIEDVALYAHTTDLRSSTLGKNDITDKQNLNLYTVFAFGRGSTLLRYASINGGFEDTNGNNIPDLQSEWDGNNDNEPDNYYEATEGAELEESIKNAFLSILKRAASGTAASVLASGEGSGANLIQAVFYPRRRFGNDIIIWTGENQNFWYYVDPFFTNSSIREDTVSDQILNLSNDYIMQFYFDQSLQMTRARLYADADGDGAAENPSTPTKIKNFDSLSDPIISLWKAGEVLWSRDIATDPRTIYTTTTGSTRIDFSTAITSTLRPYLQAIDDTEAEYIIRYMHGEGLTTVDLDGDGIADITGVDRKGTCSLTTSTSCTINSDCPSGETCVSDGIDDYRSRYARIGSDIYVWKLGDVLNSTPRIASWIQLNNYDSKYNDTSYTSFISSSGYKNRGMVFAGANDGMLHAFKLGNLELSWDTPAQGDHEIARLSGSDIGKEMWAFIPKNALPYLKYIMDPEYCHIYSVDLSPYIFDASIGVPGSGDVSDETKPDDGSTWRTILIGGMRFGGACKPKNVNCSTATPDSVCAPIEVGGSSVGYSSYFALDVTNQNSPELLWEFSHPQLGFATTGPAVVRIGDRTKNGKWFVVFGSGPTGPINTTDWQFMGHSDQNLRLFIFSLKAGPGENNANVIVKDTTIPYAFAGSMLNTTLDDDLDYQDDAIYTGYVERTSSSPYTWTNGGIGRLFTKGDVDPNKWVWSKVIDGIGPVTSSITKLQNNKKHILWLYFGTGRYYYEVQTDVDDPTNQRRLFGIKEPCFTDTNILDTTCTDTVSLGTLTDVTDIGNVPSESTANSTGFKGWYINLDLSGNYPYYEGDTLVTRAYRAERVITDPLATTTGLVFFTTYKPYNDECGLGGKSFIWAVRYTTGGPAGALLKGVALLQVSTGSIEQLNLSEAFTEAGGRKTAALEGVPPTAQGLSILSTPPPVKRVLHIRER